MTDLVATIQRAHLALMNAPEPDPERPVANEVAILNKVVAAVCKELSAALKRPEREAERPKDWYCGRCSEVVPLGERCRICGATKRESGIA